MCGFNGAGGLTAATSLVNTGLDLARQTSSRGGDLIDRMRAQDERRRLSLQAEIAAAQAEEARQLAAAEAARIRREGQDAVARQRTLQARAGGVVGSDANLLLNEDLAERFELDALAREYAAPTRTPSSGGAPSGSRGGSSGRPRGSSGGSRRGGLGLFRT